MHDRMVVRCEDEPAFALAGAVLVAVLTRQATAASTRTPHAVPWSRRP
jgi:hypothetical protein